MLRSPNPLLYLGRDRGAPPIAPFADEPRRPDRRSRLRRQWQNIHTLGGKRFLTEYTDYQTWVSLVVTNLHSLANDATDPYSSWQSVRVDNQTAAKATDYEVQILLAMANTAPANDQAIYVYICPWMYDGSTWTPAGNFSTTTRPTGSEGSASLSDPNSMRGPIVIPYRVAQQPVDFFFTIGQFFRIVPDGWSLAIRNCTGAAIAGSGSVVNYRPIKYTAT